MKKIIYILLLLLFSVRLFSYDFEVDGIYYNTISNNEVEVTYKSTSDRGYAGVINIPSSVNYNGKAYSVTSIGIYAFSGCSGLTGSLKIPNSVTTIKSNAFYGCKGLTGSLTIPNSVTTIESSAFSGCSGFTGSLTIPNSVTLIGISAFYDCSGFTGSLTIPNSVTTIGNSAFYGCSGFTGSLTIPNSVTTIGNSAFYGCRGFTGSLTIPNSVTTIGNSAFYCCIGFNGTLMISNSVKAIESYAFAGCSGFTGSLTIPNSVTTIKGYAFAGCSGFAGSLTIPNSVTTIGEMAFEDCRGFTGSLTIPNSVTTFGSGTFRRCRKIDYVISEITDPFSISDDVFQDISSNAVLLVPKGTKSVYEKFTGWTKYFKEITEEGSGTISTYTLSITASGNGSAIYNSATIKNDTQSFTVNKVSYATITFSPDNGYRIASVKVNNTDVTSSVTNNQYTISSISTNTTLSVNFEAINSDIFTAKTIEGIDMVFKIISESEKTCEVYGYSETSGNKTLIHAAIDQDYTGELMVPEKANGYSVIGISDYAFYYTKASMIVLPFGCKYIGRQALAYSAIQEIGIPGTIISIGSNAFMGCRQLTSISIPSSMEHIGFGVFFGCSNLGAITFQKGNLKEIGGGAFQDCRSLQDITIPEGVESIGSKDSGTYFIFNCAKLKTLSLPQSLLEINENLIGECPLLETITINKEIPISVDNIMLVYPYDDPLINERATLLVPKDSKGLYQKANRWKDFKQIKEIGVEDYYNLSIVASGDGVAIYNNTEIRNTTKTFTVNDGSSATISFSPDNGNSLSSVKVNGTDVTSQVANYRYTINNIKANTTISATFVKDANAITVENVNYKVVSQSDKTINLATGDYGQVLTVPASVTSNDKTWKIIGIEQDALKGNTELAAVIWNPSIVFNAEISNPNLLLYVTDVAYAPTTIQNIVVNNNAEKIVLTEAANGNNFYCPQAFTARQISYTHHYNMQTGVEESRGWETIALPFDVQTITHESKGNIKAFANWKRADTEKPFWLYELTGSGFVEASNIKANTPYIISMPNHPRYDSEWLLKGTVTFAASNVTVNKTEDVNKPTYSDRTFIPCFATKESDAGIYSLNVNNDFEKNTSGMTEGSKFVLNMRKVHPFEAYMTTTTASNRAIGIFDGMSTDIRTIENMDGQDENSYYDLQGRKTIAPTKKGVYIKNRKKVIIK